MVERGSIKRPVSAHRLPVSLPLPRALLREDAPQAAFLAQILSAPATPAGQVIGSREVQASRAYRQTEHSDIKRLPMGHRKSFSA